MSDDRTRLGRAVHARARRAGRDGGEVAAGAVAAAAAAFAARVGTRPALPRALPPEPRRERPGPGGVVGGLYPRDVAVHRPRDVVAAGPMLRAHERSARGTA